MKKYKTWEVIKMLGENPNLVFTSTDNPKDLIKMINGELVWNTEKEQSGKPYVITGFSLTKREWNLVQTPVDFIEAVRAFYMGRTIKVEIWDMIYFYTKENENSTRLIDNYGNPIAADTIINGKWYIED